MSFILLIIGFALLIKGADVFVDSSACIAKRFNVPPMIIGLTIVAMGTSAPEAAISVTSSLAGLNDMSIANVVGSNFFNILVVLGFSSILAKLPVQNSTVKKETPFLILVSFILLVFVSDLRLGRIEGLILLGVFSYFIYSTIKSAKNSTSNDEEHDSGDGTSTAEIAVDESYSMPTTIIHGIVGVISIIVGGDVVVDSATAIATSFGMSANLVGLTIIAVGTSLPEFVTSIVAIKKGETDIAIGNVIGSNLFNILLVLGLAATINPMSITLVAVIDIIFMVLITVLLYLMIKKDNSLVKKQGIILIAMYFMYMTYTIVR
ncbi:MAG: calcium/sodium antiporter [Peptostreptococcaceae bacterium]